MMDSGLDSGWSCDEISSSMRLTQDEPLCSEAYVSSNSNCLYILSTSVMQTPQSSSRAMSHRNAGYHSSHAPHLKCLKMLSHVTPHRGLKTRRSCGVEGLRHSHARDETLKLFVIDAECVNHHNTPLMEELVVNQRQLRLCYRIINICHICGRRWGGVAAGHQAAYAVGLIGGVGRPLQVSRVENPPNSAGAGEPNGVPPVTNSRRVGVGCGGVALECSEGHLRDG